MKGSIIKPFTGSALYGVTNFLATWQEDVVKAIRTCPMGDRDSYPGDYLHRLVDEGIILQTDLVEACRLYFEEKGYTDAKRPYHYGLDDVLALAMTAGYESVAQGFLDHFDELRPLMAHREDFYWKFLYVCLLAPRRQFRVWLMARDLLRETESFNSLLFEQVYGRRSYCERPVQMERELYLQELCKRIRRLRAQTDSPYDPDSLVVNLEEMLSFHFGIVWSEHGDKEPAQRETLYRQVRNKIKAWLRAQNAYVAYPVAA